ncbi:MAG: hypothetical protein QXG39_07475 [Candidatus Aenigmatarchaeota archaeon]
MNRKILLIVTIILIFIGLVFAESRWKIISNIFTGQTQVAKAQLLNIYPDASTPFPETTITGQPFKVSINVENPNPVTINGKIMVNFTKTGITQNDVYLSTNAQYKGYQVRVTKEGVFGNTLVFTIDVNYVACVYFNFNPGLNANVTHFTVQYNTEGTYSWALAVYQ